MIFSYQVSERLFNDVILSSLLQQFVPSVIPLFSSSTITTVSPFYHGHTHTHTTVLSTLVYVQSSSSPSSKHRYSAHYADFQDPNQQSSRERRSTTSPRSASPPSSPLLLSPPTLTLPHLPPIPAPTADLPHLGPLRHTIHFLLHSMLGFIIALQLRLLYNYYQQPSLGGFAYGEEPWPSTQLGFTALVPLAGVLQWGINVGLKKLGW